MGVKPSLSVFLRSLLIVDVSSGFLAVTSTIAAVLCYGNTGHEEHYATDKNLLMWGIAYEMKG